ncbi:MAG: outer membrane protein assembly factor BamE, partial [Rhodospirillaceae bacterium]|nr:outer membrane protein assembly factor BamE [Rhodospirillaceae bacterium]
MPRDRLLRRLPMVTGLAVLLLAAGGCVYRIDIQQGNLLEEDAIEQVELGMTRSQVQFLLGTPMIADSFHQDRWDYTYYF